MKNGAIYVRVSTEEQAKEGYSIDAQIKAIKKYAQNNNILIEPEYIFKDEGISGRKAEKRPAFMNMIAKAKSKPKKFDVILVHKFDRFSRNREDSIVYKSMLKKECKINVISVTEQLDPDDKMSVIIEAFLEAMAEYYSINLSEEVKKGQLEKHSKGELQTNPSFGYNCIPKSGILEINDKEAEIVKLIFNQFTIEHLPMLQIAKNINDLGIKTKRGSKFENRTINYILNNPVYIGKLKYTPGRRNSYDYDNPNTILVDGKHKAIIDNELWNETQMILAKNNKWKKPHKRVDINPTYWTKGIIRCKKCGCTMVKIGQKKLRCNGYNKGKCDNSNTINILDSYNLIIEIIKNDIKNNTIKNIISKKSKKNDVNVYNILKEKAKELSIKEKRIKEAYVDGIDSLEEYKENKKMIENEKKKLLEQLSKEEKPKNTNASRQKEIIENNKKLYEILIDKNISLKEKNDIAHIIINKVEYDDKSNTLELYYN